MPVVGLYVRLASHYKFSSPLNFVMIGDDFHKFFNVYYHVKMLAEYAMNVLTDGVFTL